MKWFWNQGPSLLSSSELEVELSRVIPGLAHSSLSGVQRPGGWWRVGIAADGRG
jgi:hypothetical protein